MTQLCKNDPIDGLRYANTLPLQLITVEHLGKANTVSHVFSMPRSVSTQPAQRHHSQIRTTPWE